MDHDESYTRTLQRQQSGFLPTEHEYDVTTAVNGIRLNGTVVRVEDTSPYFDSLGNAWAMLMGDDERDPEVYDGVDASESGMWSLVSNGSLHTYVKGTYIQWNMNHQEWNEMFDEELRSGEPLVDDNARKQFIEWFLQPYV